MPLLSNKGKSFQGSIVLGKGFVLSIEEAEKLIKKDMRNKDVLFPYLNGDDLNSDPEQKPSRWVINFFDWDEEKAKTYPDCYEIVEKLVKPERQRCKKDNDGNELVGTYALRKPLPQKWWIYGEKRPALYNAISELDQVMVLNRYTKHLAIDYQARDTVFSDSIIVLAYTSYFHFALLSSSIHEVWAWKNSSTIGTGLRYTPSSCFETFPFPQREVYELQKKGEELCQLRKTLMRKKQYGLTELYNQYNDPNTSKKSDILQLQKLHIEIDNLLIGLYGWDDIDLNHNFYELGYLSEKDRIRFTIHPTASKEILKRLLLLNLEQSKSDILDNNIVKKKLRVVSKTSTNTLFPED